MLIVLSFCCHKGKYNFSIFQIYFSAIYFYRNIFLYKNLQMSVFFLYYAIKAVKPARGDARLRPRRIVGMYCLI